MDDLPTITCDDDWLDLPTGARGVIVGRLDAVMPDGHLLIAYPDWQQVVVPIEPDAARQNDGGRALLRGLRRRVRIAVTRTEDGPVTTWPDFLAMDVLADLSEHTRIGIRT